MPCYSVFLDKMQNPSPLERAIAVTDFVNDGLLPFYARTAGACSDGTQGVLSVKLHF